MPFLILILALASRAKAQQAECTFKKPLITIHFGTGNVRDVNNAEPSNYRRIAGSCPSDGHYTFTSYTSDCFGGDWHTLNEDYTSGDVAGNMMLVNASYDGGGEFLRTSINGLKSGIDYEFALSLMNVCKISEKCPYPLLPNITIRLQTPTGKTVVQISIGDLARRESPRWTRYQAPFTAPASETPLILIMTNNAPGGCGNDFAMDDITFRECEKQVPITVTEKKTVAPKKQPVAIKQQAKATAEVGQQPATRKPVLKKETPQAAKQAKVSEIAKLQTGSKRDSTSIIKPPPFFPPAPPKLTTRANPLVKQIETGPGEIRLDLYDNGQIDDDTVSVYHNNKLVVANARLSEKPLTIRIAVDAEHPHHEVIMVAENLGSIPPNTSLMIITAGTKQYEVFISSTEQKNAKVVFNLKE